MNAGLIERPIFILGVPYQVELVALPDPSNTNCDMTIDSCAAKISLQIGTTEAYAKRLLFVAIVHRACDIMGELNDFDWDPVETFSYTYYGVLRSNPGVLAFCAGWSDEIPKTVEVSGMTLDIRLVDNCPGCDRSTLGRTVYRDQVIYMQRSMNTALMRIVLIHEIAHAVAETAALSLIDNEPFIRAFHVTLSAAMRDNPDVCRYLFDQEAEGETVEARDKATA